MLDAFLVIPATGLQASLDVNLLALVEILLANLCEIAPGNDVEPFRSWRSPSTVFQERLTATVKVVTGRPEGV
jgi:hypothetical protein